MKKLFKCLWILLGVLLTGGVVIGQENAAKWGKTSQSSDFPGYVSHSDLAIDGLATTWSHTDLQTDPWWRVDLLNVYRVRRVTVTNQETFPLRINGAVIRIGNYLDINRNPICAVISSIAAGAMTTFSCGGIEGRYVIVHISGDQKYLTLAEVGVYGYVSENLAIGGATAQSSEDWPAEKANDGDRGFQQIYNTCSSTHSETNPWWRLDLRRVYSVAEMVVTNRKDCCAELINGAEIRIGNSLENNGNNNPICAVIDSIPAGQSYKYTCNGMEGRYVNLIIPGDMKTLSLCEVEVHGEGPCVKRSFVKVQFKSSIDLTDSMRENLLNQLGSALANVGITDVTLRWSQNPKKLIQMVNTSQGRCGNGKK